MLVTVFDVLALFLAIKSGVGFFKTKEQMLAFDSLAVVIFAGCYGYLGMKNIFAYNSYVIYICICMLILNLCYYVFRRGNIKSLVIVFAFLFTLLTWMLVKVEQNWLCLVLVLPFLTHVLACDCSGIDGYTTLNTGEAIFYLLATLVLGAWFAAIISVVYLACASFNYLRVNKLSALRSKPKEDVQQVHMNRAARREQERLEKRKGKK